MNFKHNNYIIEFTEDCRDEIKEIFEYISNNLVAKKAANELMQKMKKSIYNLAKYPKIYVKISKTDKRHRDFRKMVINNYIILYTIDESTKTIYISHMYYSGRNYMNLI